MSVDSSQEETAQIRDTLKRLVGVFELHRRDAIEAHPAKGSGVIWLDGNADDEPSRAPCGCPGMFLRVTSALDEKHFPITMDLQRHLVVWSHTASGDGPVTWAPCFHWSYRCEHGTFPL